MYATQAYDAVDKKIRDLTHDLFYLKKAGSLSYAVAIYRKITITEEADIKMGYKLPSLFSILFDMRHNMRFCFRPFYYRYFDSFSSKKLPKKPFKTYTKSLRM